MVNFCQKWDGIDYKTGRMSEKVLLYIGLQLFWVFWDYSTRQDKRALSVKIWAKISERLAFRRFSLGNVAGVIPVRFLWAEQVLEYFLPLLLQVARNLAWTLMSILGTLSLYLLFMYRISTFREWSGFLRWTLGKKPNFFRPCCSLMEKISLKSFWEDMLNFLKPFFHLPRKIDNLLKLLFAFHIGITK